MSILTIPYSGKPAPFRNIQVTTFFKAKAMYIYKNDASFLIGEAQIKLETNCETYCYDFIVSFILICFQFPHSIFQSQFLYKVQTLSYSYNF